MIYLHESNKMLFDTKATHHFNNLTCELVLVVLILGPLKSISNTA